MTGSALGQTDKDGWIAGLKKEIGRSKMYDEQKLKAIDSLKIAQGSGTNSTYSRELALYSEYSMFSFDAAFIHAENAVSASRNQQDSAIAEISLAATLLSTGMFKEVFDMLQKISPGSLDSIVRMQYYILQACSYFALADYVKGQGYIDDYNARAFKALNEALPLADPKSFEFRYYSGLKNLRAGKMRVAIGFLNELLINSPVLSLHQQALVYSTYSDIYIRKGLTDSAIILLCRASIADIQSSTKETAAIFNLANLLFQLNEIEAASIFVQKASVDAISFGARQRMVQLSTIMPLIEAERVAAMERGKLGITRYATIITVLFLSLCGLILIVVKQMRRLRQQQEIISGKNLSLHKLVEDKEWLLKETHHRVKNNLHTINSLLESQSAFLRGDALLALKQTQRRIFTMSVIHQKLYDPENRSEEIDMKLYIENLVINLKDSFDPGEGLRFNLDIHPVSLDVLLAVPLGLIINEAVSNAINHAFPEKKSGVIEIALKRKDEHDIHLLIADNGTGFPDGAEISSMNSLGIKLIRGLSDDISAVLEIVDKNGVRINIEFNTAESLRFLKNAPAS